MSGLGAGLMGAPLAAYTAVLLGDTAMPTWHAAHRDLPFVFVSSASLAAGGLALVTGERGGPGPQPGGAGVIGDVVATRLMEKRMDPVAAEPLHHGTPGNLMRWAERLAVAGGVGGDVVRWAERPGAAGPRHSVRRHSDGGLSLHPLRGLRGGGSSRRRTRATRWSRSVGDSKPACGRDHRRLDHRIVRTAGSPARRAQQQSSGR